jgi:predicted MFS family arabinose efflux permease
MKIAFGWIFLIGGILLAMSCFMMALAENAHSPYKTGKIQFKEYYKKLPQYLKIEKDNTRMMIVQLMIMAASMCIPFVILFAREKLAVPDKMSAVLILVQSIGVPFGGWLWGQICDRLGPVTGIRLAVINVLLIAVIPLFTLGVNVINPMVFMVPAMFLAGVSGGIWTCNYIYTVQVVRPESRPACLVISSIITIPITFSSYLAGFISERFGFISLFTVCIGITFIAFIASYSIRPVKTVIKERNKKAIGIS